MSSCEVGRGCQRNGKEASALLAVAPACGQRCQHDKGNNTSTKGDNASVMLVKTGDDVVLQVASPVG